MNNIDKLLALTREYVLSDDEIVMLFDKYILKLFPINVNVKFKIIHSTRALNQIIKDNETNEHIVIWDTAYWELFSRFLETAFFLEGYKTQNGSEFHDIKTEEDFFRLNNQLKKNVIIDLQIETLCSYFFRFFSNMFKNSNIDLSIAFAKKGLSMCHFEYDTEFSDCEDIHDMILYSKIYVLIHEITHLLFSYDKVEYLRVFKIIKEHIGIMLNQYESIPFFSYFDEERKSTKKARVFLERFYNSNVYELNILEEIMADVFSFTQTFHIFKQYFMEEETLNLGSSITRMNYAINMVNDFNLIINDFHFKVKILKEFHTREISVQRKYSEDEQTFQILRNYIDDVICAKEFVYEYRDIFTYDDINELFNYNKPYCSRTTIMPLLNKLMSRRLTAVLQNSENLNLKAIPKKYKNNILSILGE